MTEPLSLVATIAIGEPALRRWLKSVPLSVAAFDDWPEELVDDEVPTEAPLEANVADALVTHCIDSLGADEDYIHCTYDNGAKELHFGAFYRWGGSGARASVLPLCALLRGIAAFYTAKMPSFIYISDYISIEIRKNNSQILPEPPIEMPETDWFYEWLSEHPDDPERVMANLLPSLARALKKRTSLGVLHASPKSRYHYDGNFWTDGQHVCSGYYSEDGSSVPKKLDDADPLTFHRVTPPSAMSGAFYADRRRLWYIHLETSVVQTIEPGLSVRGWTPHGMDGEPMVRCGDTVWTIAKIDYPDGEESEANLETIRSIVASQGGIIVNDRFSSVEYLRPVRVDGHSFTQIKDSLFEDRQAVYYQTGQGLIRMKEMIPGKTTIVENLFCNNGRTFIHSRQTTSQPDTASLRHIYGLFYCGRHEIYRDNRHVYILYFGEHYEHPLDLYRLEGADPASFRILRTFTHAPLCRDDNHVWVGSRTIPDVHPDSVRFFGKSYYWRDGPHVYYEGKPIPDADAESFAEDGYYEARDKHRLYKGASPIAELP